MMNRLQPKAVVQTPKIQPKIAPKPSAPVTNQDISSQRTDELNKRLEEEMAKRGTAPKSNSESVKLESAKSDDEPKSERKNKEKLEPKKKRVAPKPVEESPLSEEHRRIICDYIALDDEIAQKKAELGALKKRQSELQLTLAVALKNVEAPVKSGNTVLRVKTSNTLESVSQAFLIRKLAESGELKNPENAKTVVTNIYKAREVKGVKESIERKD